MKKGTSPLAIHARAASRYLEAQVGTNPRIHVQRDEDFCPWDDIYSEAAAASASATAVSSTANDTFPPEDRAPEWMRQTVCCAMWEMRPPPQPSGVGSSNTPSRPHPVRVALAVVKPLLNPPTEIPVAASASVAAASDPPPPPSNPTTPYVGDAASTAINRHSSRATGDLIRVWAPLFGIKVLHIEQGASEHGHSGSSHHQRNTHTSDGKPHHVSGSKRGDSHRRNRSSEDPSGSISPRSNLVEKVKNGLDSKSIVVAPGAPAAVTGVPPGVNKIRLLTRGEKLEP